MISWIQRSFQHHFRTVFAVLLAITIISFILTIGATPGIGRADRRVVSRDFFGYNLASRDEMGRVMNDAGLSLELQIGANGGLDENQVRNYALQRVAALHLADAWHVPAATTGEETAFIRELRIFADQSGSFDAARYANFRASLRGGAGTSEADIARVITDDIRAQKAEQLLNGPGYVLPDDVRSQLILADTTWTVATATVDYASFQPSIKPTETELAKYYQENEFRYEIPVRIAATYLDFPAAAYLSDVKGVTDAKAKLDKAKRLAAKAASDTAYALYETKVTPGAALDAFLSARKLTPKPLAPFSADAGPTELGGSPEVVQAAAALDSQRFYSEALSTPTGAAIILWKDSLPARKPLLAEIKAKVTTDDIDNERRKRFAELGRTLRGFLETRLKAGDTFDKAAAAAASANGVKIEAKTLPAFTLRSRPKDLNPTVSGELENLGKGQVSEMAIAADKGYLLYAIDKKSPDLSPASPQFAQMRASIAFYTARTNAGAYLDELVSQELKRTEPAVK